MKTIKTILIAFIFSSVLTACNQSSDERLKSSGEQLKGNAQETIGNITNDDKLKDEGKENKLKGDLRSTKEDVKDLVTDN